MLVYVARQIHDDLKIVWRVGGYSIGQYLIPRSYLLQSSARIRRCLERLVSKYDPSAGPGSCRAQLNELANAGFQLYQMLFEPSDDNEDASRVQRWLKEHGPLLIRFVLEEAMHIPWGLVFDSDPSNLTLEQGDSRGAVSTSEHFKNSRQASETRRDEASDRPRVELEPSDLLAPYDHFWCLRYWLAATSERIKPPSTLDVIPKNSLCILPVLNRSVLEKSLGRLDASEREDIVRFLGSHKPVYNKQALDDRWSEINEAYRLVYVLSHANPTRLELDADDAITPEDIYLLPKKRSGIRPNHSLLILNGCFTAGGDQGDGFLEATQRSGFFGFVGAETSIPQEFAVRFGQEFLSAFHDTGQCLYEIMHELRCKHWPLGLLYSIYCSPWIEIAPPGTGPTDQHSSRVAGSPS
jgi:hypothetical protein